jgi:hypothetical protein
MKQLIVQHSKFTFFAFLLVAAALLVSAVLPASLLESTQHSTGLPAEVSQDTRLNLQQFLDRHPNVVVISLLSLDFQGNVRNPRAVIIASPQIQNQYTAETDRFPIFSKNKKQNNEMISLIYGKTLCVPSSQSVFYEKYNLKGLIELSCRFPMSPIGRLAGYLAIHFAKNPSEAELKQTLRDADLLAISIYLKEVHETKDYMTASVQSTLQVVK